MRSIPLLPQKTTLGQMIAFVDAVVNPRARRSRKSSKRAARQ